MINKSRGYTPKEVLMSMQLEALERRVKFRSGVRDESEAQPLKGLVDRRGQIVCEFEQTYYCMSMNV